MTTFVPSLEEITVHLAAVSPDFRAFVEGGQAALDDAEASHAAQASQDAQAVLDASTAAALAQPAPAPADAAAAPVDPSAPVA